MDSKAYQTYYAFASGEKAPKPKYIQKKVDHDTSPKQKLVQVTKGTRIKSKAKVAKQLKLATKRSKTQFHSSHASGLGNGVNTQSKLPDDKDEDNENDSDDLSDKDDDDNDGNNGNNCDDDDANDDAKQEGDDTNDDDEENDSDRTESDRIKIPILDQSTTEYYKEGEEKIDDEEMIYDDEDDEVTKELYEDVNVNLGNEDTEMTNVDQGDDEHVKSSSVSSDFTRKLLNLKNPSPADNEIASLMETSARHATAIPEITSATTSFTSLLDFASVFKFNERVTNLEKDLSEIKQVDQYAQALSSIPAIVDCYMDNKLGEAINKAIQAHNFDCREEARVEKREYIKLVDSTSTYFILPQVISDVVTPVIEKNVTESLEAAVLTRSSSQPQSSYEAAATL
ncbi:hypothetical protein Tco_0886166 [Tanacetum coccineum]